jgi:hypothetical protein
VLAVFKHQSYPLGPNYLVARNLLSENPSFKIAVASDAAVSVHTAEARRPVLLVYIRANGILALTIASARLERGL